ncbi:hypothetical protein RUM43_014670 [Polyplax serrata]|uniref:Uncharacterized protein n=1 Tax=Polyplax serrata TaxID=468196 RepID=A0AAN8NYU6_POLSC
MNTYEDFRSVVREERENLTKLSDLWNSKVNCDKSFSREIEGRIRAAVGKTRLLLAEKFKQFEGLIDQSENNTSEKEISINDLQGFWDLVLIQVNEVKEIFRDLECRCGKSRSREPDTKCENGPRKKSNDVEQKLKESIGKEKAKSQEVKNQI